MNPANSLVNKLLDIFLPDTCLLCDQVTVPQTSTGLCKHCREVMPVNTHACVHCGLPLTGSSTTCGPCSDHPLVPGRCIVPLIHDELSGHLVHRLKFHNGFREARCLAAIMAERILAAEVALPEAIIPVPLAYLSEVKRGYNQATELAEALGKAIGVPVLRNSVARRHGPSQRTLSRAERRKLSPHAFRVKRAIHADHVALVDDVMTTGSTIRALAQAICRDAPIRVDAWCATRAIRR